MASADLRRVADGGGAGGTFQPYLDSLRQELQQTDPTLLSVVVAVLAVLLTLGKRRPVVMAGSGRAEVRAERAPWGHQEGETHPVYTPPSRLKQRQQRGVKGDPGRPTELRPGLWGADCSSSSSLLCLSALFPAFRCSHCKDSGSWLQLSASGVCMRALGYQGSEIALESPVRGRSAKKSWQLTLPGSVGP